jgi:peptidoglycan/LPS O-acetylase OafA/YrhL
MMSLRIASSQEPAAPVLEHDFIGFHEPALAPLVLPQPSTSKTKLPLPASPAAQVPGATFASLTAMRGVAALLVAFFHLRFGVMGVPWFDSYIFSFRFGNRGYLWVDFFFILSGFILAYRYGENCRALNWRSYGHFVWQRFARVWPLHLVTMGFAIVYLLAKHGGGYLTRASIMTNLFLAHSWGYYFAPPLNFPSWSLSCEWGAYLFLPAYLLLVLPLRRGRVHALLLAGLFALLVWYATRFGAGTLDQLRERWGLGRCLIEVAIGVSLFCLYAPLSAWKTSRGTVLARRVTAGSDTVAAVIFCAIFVVFTFVQSDLWFVPLAGALILALSLAEGPFSSLLERRPMVLLGEISFSIYMLHGFVLWICQDTPASFKARLPFWGGAVWLLAAHVLVIGLAYASFKLIERPAHRALAGR